AVEDAKFTMNYLPESTTNAGNKSNKNTYETEQRALKSAKADKELALRNAYVQLEQSEANYNQAVADLARAEADYKVAEVTYNAGNTTLLTLQQAALGVEQAKNTVNQIALAYDMQVFSFENSSLIS
ncbi:MAG: TolC family protein, partial [Anaerotignum sp.]